jgi:hypothetical protein
VPFRSLSRPWENASLATRLLTTGSFPATRYSSAREV